MASKKRLGEVLVDAGLLNETQLSAALQSQRTWGGKLGSTLVRMGFAREEDILRALSSQLLLPAVDFNKVKVSTRAVHSVPMRVAEKYHVMPVALREEQGKKQIVLVMSDPTNLEMISEIEFQTGCRVRPAVATDSAISRAIDFYYRTSAGNGGASMREEAKPVTLSKVDDTEPMKLVSDDRAKETPSDAEMLENLGTGQMLKLLLRTLLRKKIISRSDLIAELNRRRRR